MKDRPCRFVRAMYPKRSIVMTNTGKQHIYPANPSAIVPSYDFSRVSDFVSGPIGDLLLHLLRKNIEYFIRVMILCQIQILQVRKFSGMFVDRFFLSRFVLF